MNLLSRCWLLLFFLLCPLDRSYSQTKADQQLIKQARSLYYARGLRPAYIACDVTIDWDAVAKQADLPETEGRRRGLELAKNMKVSVTTRGASQTEVSTEGDASLAPQKQVLERQLKGFFDAYWKDSYGRLLPPSGFTYLVTPSPDGYLVTLDLEEGVSGTLTMNRSLMITKLLAKGHPTELELTPRFEKQGDGLFYLTDIRYERRFGDSRTIWEYNIDYQPAREFYVPQHVTMSMPGALSYKYTFSNCVAQDKANAPAPALATPDPDVP